MPENFMNIFHNTPAVLFWILGGLAMWMWAGVMYLFCSDTANRLKSCPPPSERSYFKSCICISGGLRTFRDCIPSFREYVLRSFAEPPDVFILFNKEESLKDIEDALHLFSPIAWGQDELCNMDEFPKDWTFDEKMVHVVGRKIHRCDLLRQEHEDACLTSYDVIVRWRPDLRAVSRIPPKVIYECTHSENPVLYYPTTSVTKGTLLPNALYSVYKCVVDKKAVNDQMFVTNVGNVGNMILSPFEENNVSLPQSVEGIVGIKLKEHQVSVLNFTFPYYIKREGMDIPLWQFVLQFYHSFFVTAKRKVKIQSLEKKM